MPTSDLSSVFVGSHLIDGTYHALALAIAVILTATIVRAVRVARAPGKGTDHGQPHAMAWAALGLLASLVAGVGLTRSR